jgi:PRTRC genetic system ThiF family protein
MAKRNKFKGRGRHGQAPRRPAAVEVLPKLDLGFLHAATVEPGDFGGVQIILAGAGGTGAYMAQHVGRMMTVLEDMGKGVHLTIADPDVVKEENLGRQLFCRAEVGAPKAEALARRYGHAWGLNVYSYVGKYDESLLLGAELTVLVGCVDNAEARRALHETLENNAQETGPHSRPAVWWLDCGNGRDTGRGLLGTASVFEQLRGAFPGGERCLSLPGPVMQSPGILMPEREEVEGGGMSCAEMAAANLQSLNVNARVAAEAADMLTRLLVTKDLKRFKFEVNLAAGSMRSWYATPEEVARVINKPVSYVRARQMAAAG